MEILKSDLREGLYWSECRYQQQEYAIPKIYNEVVNNSRGRHSLCLPLDDFVKLAILYHLLDNIKSTHKLPINIQLRKPENQSPLKKGGQLRRPIRICFKTLSDIFIGKNIKESISYILLP